MLVANIQTTVVMDESFHRMNDVADIKSAMHISIDPITQKKECFIYTDDGKGNGVLIFKFEM